MKKDLENLERFGGFIRLTTHQLVSAKPTVGVCLTAQKSYKSGQIEQINIDEKRFGEFGKIWRISRRSRLKESVSLGTEILQIGTNRTNKYR